MRSRLKFSNIPWFVLGLCVLIGSPFVMGDFATAAPPTDPFAGVTQNWDQNLPITSRFTVLSDFGGKAVRDNNTGLVWEQAPLDFVMPWAQATTSCLNKSVIAGGPRGWRLPSIVELLSLINGNSPPPASVFTGALTANYWSATTVAWFPEELENVEPHQMAWVAIFSDGHLTRELKSQERRAWCVRGGMNADQY
jgi:hypothetical protein